MRKVRPLPPELTTILFNAGARRIVLVEGDNDKTIFESWYADRLAYLAFFDLGGGGKVEDFLLTALAMSATNRIFGIVDRDFKEDAEALSWQSEADPHLFVLNRHEIENYLLEPFALNQEIATIRLGESDLPSVTDIEAKLLELCQDLKSLVAANLVCVRKRIPSPFGDTAPIKTRDEVLMILASPNKLACTLQDADNELSDAEKHINPHLGVLKTAHTRIAGKLLLHHVHQFYAAKAPREVFRNYLIRAIHRLGIPPDIRHIIEDRILKYP